ncbi:MAG: EscU/YscU/HrcU family type III secretion system export apparatus switch protein [Treponema sp.]|jgi:flagellar biosynthesis protein|nr:EscU/YscU/HrcU family type III secretion system export apparatus switch protein [Treponema sp.]
MRRCNIDSKRRISIALAYDPADIAPRVIASGQGAEAERIIAIAEEAGVRIMEDAALAALLNSVPPGEIIPEWCWETVAKILSFVLAGERG